MNPFKEPKESPTVPVIAPEGTPEDSGMPDLFVVDRNDPDQQASAAEHGWDTLEKIAKTSAEIRKLMEQN